MSEIVRNRTIRPSTRLEKSKSYKIDTKQVSNADSLTVNIDHESKPFKKTYKFNGADLALKDSISFRVTDYGTHIDISWSGAKPIGTTASISKPIIGKQATKPEAAKPKTSTSATSSSSNINSILEKFRINRFDPTVDSETKVHDAPGNYILCLRKNSTLPAVPLTPTLTIFEGLDVIYTGIASGSLRKRDYRQHFNGNAGRSSLRKSIGVLFSYKQIPRDKDPDSGKTKFDEQDEQKLTNWMHSNLIMFFLPTMEFNTIEIMLIDHFNPPLNLKDNHNSINAEFRKLLSALRSSNR